MTYDADNIFAKILRGELPCHKVFENDDTLAFLDIMPRADGHTLVIPKTPARNILDASEAQLECLIHTVKRVSQAAMTAFEADGLTVQHFSEEAGGQIVFHIHFHVLPRHTGVSLRPPGTMAEDSVLAAHADVLRKALQ